MSFNWEEALVPHGQLYEFLIVSGWAFGLGVVHKLLHDGGLAIILGPKLMAPLLSDESKQGNSPPPPTGKLTASQKADAKNEDIKKWAHLADNNNRGINVKLHTTVQDVVMTIVSILLFVFYVIFMMDPAVKTNVHDRIRVNSPMSYFALRLHCASTLYEIMLYMHVGKDYIAYAHHILVLGNFARCLTRGTFHYYSAWLGTVEGTNPFLSGTFALMRLGLIDSPWLTGCTVGLLASFFVLRVINLPVCFHTLILDRPFIYDGANHDSIFENERFFFDLGLITVIILWILSVWWFGKMVKGMLKRLKQAKKTANKSE